MRVEVPVCNGMGTGGLAGRPRGPKPRLESAEMLRTGRCRAVRCPPLGTGERSRSRPRSPHRGRRPSREREVRGRSERPCRLRGIIRQCRKGGGGWREPHELQQGSASLRWAFSSGHYRLTLCHLNYALGGSSPSMSRQVTLSPSIGHLGFISRPTRVPSATTGRATWKSDRVSLAYQQHGASRAWCQHCKKSVHRPGWVLMAHRHREPSYRRVRNPRL